MKRPQINKSLFICGLSFLAPAVFCFIFGLRPKFVLAPLVILGSFFWLAPTAFCFIFG
jgi:hypothetical protein